MTSLPLVSNCLSFFFVLSAFVFWFSLSLHPTILPYIVVWCTFGSITSWYLLDHSSSYFKRIRKAVFKVFLNLCIFVPIFAILICLACVYTQALNRETVLMHSFLLSTLVNFPNDSLSRSIFNFEIKPDSDSKSSDYTRFLVITLMSYFASFLYGLDRHIQLAHYPVASCSGALVGSLLINLVVFCHLIKKYNTCVY